MALSTPGIISWRLAGAWRWRFSPRDQAPALLLELGFGCQLQSLEETMNGEW